MKSKLNIQSVVVNKTLRIPLILFFSVSLFMTHAFAGDCEGGDDCFKCGQMDHRPAAIPETGYMPTGCQPGLPDSACGIAASHLSDGRILLISAPRVENHQNSGAAADPAIEYGAILFTRKIISPDQLELVTTAPPIYLSNLSLLC